MEECFSLFFQIVNGKKEPFELKFVVSRKTARRIKNAKLYLDKCSSIFLQIVNGKNVYSLGTF